MELTVETQWGDDGGKQIVRKRKDDIQIPPDNPGDVKGRLSRSCPPQTETMMIVGDWKPTLLNSISVN